MVVEYPLLHNPWFQLCYSLPLYLLGFWVFGRSAWQSVKHGLPNMDVLIVTGVVAAFVYSFWGTLMATDMHSAQVYLFYETGTTIISLVLLGNLIEKRSVKQTASELNELQKVTRQSARKVELHDGHEHIVEVTFAQIKSGDLFLVNTGDLIPIDGIIIKGDAAINESILTGESLPVNKSTGMKVIGGSVVEQGPVYIRAEVDSRHSFISSVVELLKKAQADKPTIQRLSDRISVIFVQVVIVLALLTFLMNIALLKKEISEAIMRSIAVLVISCPCAMGLATPTAVMVGIGKLARKGILVTKAGSIETFSGIRNLVFDKTGTLTDGQFRFEVAFTRGINEQELKNMAIRLEHFSSHPIAKSILRQKNWLTEDVVLKDVRETKGMGVTGTDAEGNVWQIGSGLWNEQAEDASDLVLYKNQVPVGGFLIRDELKKGVSETMDYFKKQGIRTVMLSGDSETKCRELGNQAGIQSIYARQSPADKLKVLESFTNQGTTAMAGDGINDAPALARASVAVSFAGATEIARQTAQFVMVHPSFANLIDAHRISRQTYRTIKQNLFWALAYNVVAIPLAAFGFMHPMLAAASMAFSDVVVIGNALRLRYTSTKF